MPAQTRRRVGLWLVGAFGGVGTTITVGLSALARGLRPTTGLVTDLPMFALMPDLAGIGMSVGEGIPRADYHFENPSAVRHWLDTLSRHRAGTS